MQDLHLGGQGQSTSKAMNTRMTTAPKKIGPKRPKKQREREMCSFALFEVVKIFFSIVTHPLLVCDLSNHKQTVVSFK